MSEDRRAALQRLEERIIDCRRREVALLEELVGLQAESGRLLLEARSLVPRGQWTCWTAELHDIAARVPVGGLRYGLGAPLWVRDHIKRAQTETDPDPDD